MRHGKPAVSSESIPASWQHADPLLFSGVWVATAAASLSAAAERSMGLRHGLLVPALAFLGTLAIYGLDRLRDLERDRGSAPLRSAFVARHRRALAGIAIAAGAGATLLALRAGPRALALVSGVAALGIAHRRLKRIAALKPVYLTGSWLVVTVGLPAAVQPGAAHLGWVAAVVGAALLSNVVASNLRDGEALAARFGERRALRVARGMALLGVACAALAPPAVRPLGAVPLAMGIALLAFRRSERYGLGAVDGALVAGAAVAMLSGSGF